jgi:hypothetical protein
MKKVLSGILLSLFVLGGCAGMFVKPAPPDEAAIMDCGPFPYDYQEKIMTDMNRKLIDPYSAQYGFNEPQKARYKGDCGWYVLMSVNAKNRFGGYVGAETHQFIIYKGTLEEINIVQSAAWASMH